MVENPIVEEVHRIREQLLAEHSRNLHALFETIRRGTEQAARAWRKVVTLPPPPAQS